MPIEPVKIPQNVYVEDRIIGPITLKQLIIVGIGSGFSYAIYATVAKVVPMSVPLTIILWSPAMVAAAFAFIKINDLSLFNIILLTVEHMSKPTTRVWCAHPGITINIVTRPQKEKERPVQQGPAANVRLDEIARQLAAQQKQIEQLTNSPEETAAALQMEQDEPTVIEAKEPSISAIVEEKSQDRAESKPVPKDRIVVSGLDPARAVDGLQPSGLSAFQHIFHPQQ